MLQTGVSLLPLPAGCISRFHEKPSGDDLASLKDVSKNATEQDPFEVSMGIYVFKRDVLVSLSAAVTLSCRHQLPSLSSEAAAAAVSPIGLAIWIPACLLVQQGAQQQS